MGEPMSGIAHQTVRVSVRGFLTADIDVKLAPLVKLLWKAKVSTCECCQEYYPGLASIEFPGTSEATRFLDVAQRNYKVELESVDEAFCYEDGRQAVCFRLLVLFPVLE